MQYKILYFGIVVVVSKVLYNFYYFLLARYYLKKYQAFLDTKKDWYIQENRQKIISTLKKAGLEDTYLPNVEPIGYGYVSTAGISVFKNLSLLRKDVCQIVYGFLKEAVAVYKSRMIESINPVYWIEAFIFLPKVIFQYLGLSAKGLVVKIFQVIWWILTFVSLVVGIFFNETFTEWIKTLI